jgi:hypothetical protein
MAAGQSPRVEAPVAALQKTLGIPRLPPGSARGTRLAKGGLSAASPSFADATAMKFETNIKESRALSRLKSFAAAALVVFRPAINATPL